MRRLLVGALTTLAAGAVVAPTTVESRAWPRLMMFYGGVLGEQRRHITDWYVVADFFTALQASGATTPPDAPYVEVGLYWHGPTWEPYIVDPAKLKTLPLPPAAGPVRPGGEITGLVQPARLYLAVGNRPAIFDYYSAPHYPGLQPLGRKAVEILEQVKVPLRK